MISTEEHKTAPKIHSEHNSMLIYCVSIYTSTHLLSLSLLVSPQHGATCVAHAAKQTTTQTEMYAPRKASRAAAKPYAVYMNNKQQ